MASLFPQEGGLTKDRLIEVIADIRSWMRNNRDQTMEIKQELRELRVSIEEMANRFDADVDTLRNNMNRLLNLERRVDTLENNQTHALDLQTKFNKSIELDVMNLKNFQTGVKTSNRKFEKLWMGLWGGACGAAGAAIVKWVIR